MHDKISTSAKEGSKRSKMGKENVGKEDRRLIRLLFSFPAFSFPTFSFPVEE